MELLDVAHGDAVLHWGGRGVSSGRSVHEDVLRGCDWEVGGWEGVYTEGVERGGEFHAEMEGWMGW